MLFVSTVIIKCYMIVKIKENKRQLGYDLIVFSLKCRKIENLMWRDFVQIESDILNIS